MATMDSQLSNVNQNDPELGGNVYGHEDCAGAVVPVLKNCVKTSCAPSLLPLTKILCTVCEQDDWGGGIISNTPSVFNELLWTISSFNITPPSATAKTITLLLQTKVVCSIAQI